MKMIGRLSKVNYRDYLLKDQFTIEIEVPTNKNIISTLEAMWMESKLLKWLEQGETLQITIEVKRDKKGRMIDFWKQ